MNDDPRVSPERAGLEARLRRALSSRAGIGAVGEANWADLAGRIARSTRRRQRVLAGAGVLALVVGAAGGYFGEAAASSGGAAGSLASGSITKAPSVRNPSGGAGPRSSAVPCREAPTGGSASDTGTATHLFSRSTADGVTIRVYRLTSSPYACGSPGGSASQGGAPGSTGGGVAGGTPPSTGAPANAPATGRGPVSSPPQSNTVLPTCGGGMSIELSDDTAVGLGTLGSPVGLEAPSPGQPATATTTAPSGGAVGVAPTSEPQSMSSAAFGVAEGDPVWWIAVQVGAEVASAKATFADGSSDQMTPVDGVAVLAHHISSQVASTDSGPSTVRATLVLLGAGGEVLATVTLPEQPKPIPLPAPAPAPAAGNGSTGTGSTGTGSTGTGSIASSSAGTSVPGGAVACPQVAAPKPG